MSKMIVWLGNPGSKYAHTKHNVWFDIIDMRCQYHTAPNRDYNDQKQMMTTTVSIWDQTIYCCKPMSYMNHSGDAVLRCAQHYQISAIDIVVISDDLDLIWSKIRLKLWWSHGGHNGLRDIILKLGSDQFWRCKYGIGRSKDADIVQYVLSPMSQSDLLLFQEKRQTVIDIIDNRIVNPKPISL